jgi:protein-disulfide isomerase
MHKRSALHHRQSASRALSCILATTAVACGVRAEAKSRDKVFVTPVQGKEVKPAVLEALFDLVVVAVSRADIVSVVTVEDVREQLAQEKRKDALGCSSVSCATQLAGALGVRYLLATRVKKLGGNLLVTTSFIDTVEQESKSGQGKCPDNETEYEKAVEAAVAEVLGVTKRPLVAERDEAQPKPQAATPPAPPSAHDTVFPAPVDQSPTRGPSDAWVTIVEWAEFQCPFSARVTETLRQIEEKYGSSVRFVFRMNPLAFHPRALPAAIAALCAHEQGKFWPMHDLLFANQGSLDDEALGSYATRAGAEANRWSQCYSERKPEPTIQREQKIATDLGASGTPTFFINGKKIGGSQPLEAFTAVIDAELERARASGIPRKDYYRKAILGAR